MNAKQVADELENIYWIQGDGKGKPFQQYADFVRQQQAEIENLKNANRFIQNFAEEQHQRAVALEMREVTDEEILDLCPPNHSEMMNEAYTIDFARAILKKASEK